MEGSARVGVRGEEVVINYYYFGPVVLGAYYFV
jgi:hypothetical protein